MTKYLILIIATLTIAGCNNNEPKEIGETVWLYRDGTFKKSEVKKTGVYCTAAWYKIIDNFILKRDGTAIDGHWKYRWTLSEFGNDKDQKWFDKNCKELE